jgi:hypothetical protein
MIPEELDDAGVNYPPTIPRFYPQWSTGSPLPSVPKYGHKDAA